MTDDVRVRRSRRAPLFDTWPGRAILLGVVAKLATSLAGVALGGTPAWLSFVDTLGSLAILGGAAYFIVRLFVLAKRRLLWRVRRKLLLSYFFIGVVPVVLASGFFVLFVLILLLNFSSYLVQTEVTALQDRARYLASTITAEIQRGSGRDVTDIFARRLATVSGDFPGASAALVPLDGSCSQRSSAIEAAGGRRIKAGPWMHGDPPAAIPSWIGCEGFVGLLAQSDIVARAVAFPESTAPAYAVVVDLPFDDQPRTRLRDQSGIEVTSVNPLSDRVGTDQTQVTVTGNGPLGWVTFLAARDWLTGESRTLLAMARLSLQAIYQRIASAPGVLGNQSIGQTLLRILLIVVGGLFLVIEVVALIVGSALARSITGSVHELFSGTERVRHGDFTHKIAVTADDQLGELAQSFNSMTDSIEDLLREAAEKKRLEEELRIAHEIQMSLLPQGPLGMPGLSITALCVPAREVGGDYYDLFPLGDGRLGVLIADVSGKGTSAALYMAELKGLVLSLSKIYTSPRELLISANRTISDHLDARSFITMTYAVVDTKGRRMTYARAGHTPLIYVPGPGVDGRAAQVLAPDGLVVGLKLDAGEMFEQLLKEETMPLHSGDLYVLFTDGISEAMNAADDCFGEQRLGRLVQEHADLPSDELRERVLREVQAFVGGAPQHDDMTMILLKVDA